MSLPRRVTVRAWESGQWGKELQIRLRGPHSFTLIGRTTSFTLSVNQKAQCYIYRAGLGGNLPQMHFCL